MNTIDISREWRRVLHLGWPVSLQALATSAFAMLDVAMVQGLGPAALGAVGLAGRLLFFVTMMLAGLCGGAAALMAQHAGRDDVASGGRLVRLLAVVAVGATLPLALWVTWQPQVLAHVLTDDAALAGELARYLAGSALSLPLFGLVAALATAARCYGDSRSALLASLGALAVNAVLNAVLIFGLAGAPALGVLGAGIATTLARAVELALLLALLSRRHDWFAALRAGLRSPRWRVAGFGSVALPVVLQEAAWAGGMLATTLLFATMGRDALALTSLLAPFEGVLINVFVGAAVGCGIVVGQWLGRERFDVADAVARHALRRLAAVGVPVCALGGALAAGLLPQIGWLAGREAEAVAMALLTALLVGIRIVSMTLVLGVLRAGGDQRGVIAIDLLTLWGLGLPLAAVAALVWGWSLPAVVAVLVASDAVKAALLMHRMAQGHWRRRLVGAGGGHGTPPAGAPTRVGRPCYAD